MECGFLATFAAATVTTITPIFCVISLLVLFGEL